MVLRNPLLGDANTFPRKRLAYENERCFLRGPCLGILNTIWAIKSVDSSVREAVKRELQSEAEE
jgi:hypothetical protein